MYFFPRFVKQTKIMKDENDQDSIKPNTDYLYLVASEIWPGKYTQVVFKALAMLYF